MKYFAFILPSESLWIIRTTKSKPAPNYRLLYYLKGDIIKAHNPKEPMVRTTNKLQYLEIPKISDELYSENGDLLKITEVF